MSLRALRTALLLAVTAVLIPACGKSGQDGLMVVRFSPNSNGVERCPIIYVQFNKPLKSATVTTANVFLDSPLVNETITVTYNDALNEIRIVPSTDLAASTDFQITIMPGIQAAAGDFSPGEFLYFRTAPGGTVNRPAFNGVDSLTALGPTSIKVDWLVATDPDATTITYDVFIATETGGEDMTRNPKASVTALTATITNLNSATQYFVKVRARNAAGNLDINDVELNVTTP